MMKGNFKNILVLGVIFLFIFTAVIPSISASVKNNNKAVATIWVFGLMKPLSTQSNHTKVFVIFAFYKSEGSPGGILKVFHFYDFWDCVYKSYKFWTICWCTDITDT